MGVFHCEKPPNPSKGCKFPAEPVKGALSACRNRRGQLSISRPKVYLKIERETDREEIVSAIRSQGMEKLKHKPLFITDNFSVGCCLSHCSSALGGKAFFSLRTNFSHCSSFDGTEFPDFWEQSVIFLELCRCEGWPFGQCRKTLKLPPLPKSPPDSWKWKKGTKTINKNRAS